MRSRKCEIWEKWGATYGRNELNLVDNGGGGHDEVEVVLALEALLTGGKGGGKRGGKRGVRGG